MHASSGFPDSEYYMYCSVVNTMFVLTIPIVRVLYLNVFCKMWTFSQNWTKLSKLREPWPEERSRHAACCLNYGHANPQLLVTAGEDMECRALADTWILDVERETWKEVWVFTCMGLDRTFYVHTYFITIPSSKAEHAAAISQKKPLMNAVCVLYRQILHIHCKLHPLCRSQSSYSLAMPIQQQPSA